MEQKELIPHLFRTEFRKIVSVLVKFLGVDQIEAAEDIASETFTAALESWSYKGLPENPAAWLYTAAKNKAKNYMRRNNIFAEKIVNQLVLNSAETVEQEIDLSDTNITDSQLKSITTTVEGVRNRLIRM